ncbi:MAG: hypothetical protein APG12_01010 [Candidatus Methanofastidiosum methylothiophilum]|uniref:UPF0215 protein APG10_01417 n=1 Tax=Candidatus Methanofastidiosum methylothiophilum TaxID=1705564 RepID=A0A150IRK3_9EURY|nr:MAG: hypothetical protein APG10_01417 [Candidatus Methanofastidiosum methylthiophilus]KYC47542.1 MAG: hypothetical protein APG11_01041 [Candidatus Methanofastidiosum methylthiophilus]KYC50190.1 MAG: hypothetical protein APG12_01010 [Candidatus Methanofastidiosum methylthiophilus]
MRIKREIRILGIDDSNFTRADREVLVVGALLRGGYWIDGVVSTHVERDGLDATEKITNMVNKARYKDLRAIMLKGVTLAGFNLIDIEKLNLDTGLPVVVVMRKMPDIKSMEKALTNLDYKEKRIEIIKNAGKIYEGTVQEHSEIFFQFKGIEEKDARELIRISSMHSNIPEPLRVAHIIATGVVRGESTKKP